MTAALRDLLELASDDVPDLDLATEAWDEARLRHRAVLRRTVIGAGGVTALGGLFVVLRERPPEPEPTVTAPVTVGADGRLPTAEVDGVMVHLAPDPPAEARLPRYPRAADLAIPRHLGPADPAIRGSVGRGALPGVAEPLRAVFLVVAEGGGHHPVLFAPEAPVQAEVPAIRINEWEGVTQVLAARSISDDRHRLVVRQPGRVVVLDARDGTVLDIEVPDPTLSLAGWARDRTTVVARGRSDGWLVDPQTRTVHRTSRAVSPDWADLAQGEGTAELRSFAGSGELTDSRPLLGPPVVPSTGSVSNTEGWVAGGVFLPGVYQSAVNRSQGLVAVHSDLPPMPRVLAATGGPLVPKAAYRVLAWGPHAVVLFESRSERAGFQGMVRRVLAWDVNEGRLYQVADVDRAGSRPGDFSGTYAL